MVVAMDRSAFRPKLASQSDVETMWRRLMSPLGFSSASLWVVVVHDQRPVPKILEIDQLGDPPAGSEIDAFAELLRPLVAPDVRFALLLSRPGGGRPDHADRAWGLALYDAGRRAGATLEVIHLAHDRDVLPLAIDDLLAEPA